MCDYCIQQLLRCLLDRLQQNNEAHLERKRCTACAGGRFGQRTTDLQDRLDPGQPLL